MIIDVVMLAYSKDHVMHKMTQEAIDSLHVSSDIHKFNIILVETRVADVKYNGATVIHSELPFNYNRNLNLGVSKCAADWIIICNNDLIFEKNWIDPILSANYDSASPVSPGWKPHSNIQGKTYTGFRTSIELCGWCIVVKKATLEKIGKFDEQFDFMAQDNDYAFQLMQHQLTHALVGTSCVKHLVAQSHTGYGSAKTNAQIAEGKKKLEAKYLNKKSTICLTMIVKNESTIIEEMLNTVVDKINYWCVCDTGSSDGTQKIIQDFFAKHKIPGELHERPWVDFGYNRTEALKLADGKADYIFVLDADDKVRGNLEFKGLLLDTYFMKIGNAIGIENSGHWRNQLFRSGLEWKYCDVIHEYPESKLAKTSGRLNGDYYIEACCAGSRSKDPLKYQKDAELLEKELLKRPDYARYWFYLGQSYFDSKNYNAAKRAYQKRVELGGWGEEQFNAAFRLGLCAIQLKESDDAIILYMIKAYELRPSRAESLHTLVEYFRAKEKYALAYLFAKTAAAIPMPTADIMRVHYDVYKYRALDELAVCANYTGHHQESITIFKHILDNKLCPTEQRARIQANLTALQKAI